MSAALKDHEVVPDVVDSAPPHALTVKYGSLEICDGNVITPTHVFEEPTEITWPTEPNALYTLCMTDPDAPSRKDPKSREFLHWLLVNIPGCDLVKGEALAEYVGSGPPKGTGLHRYVFLAYKQPGPVTCDEPKMPNNSPDNRRKFSIRNFAAKYGMTLIGANFYLAEYDETSLKVHRQMGLIL
ncbi:Phosphatidylethanolamine-binding protein 1 [Halocaridina rubra]|uniref:Phosphatidylethanolamine-binding protein 1 n=1 Tax=Halocaridina rubra TaxID=373956 RepID=A0AAN9AH09_HALRR